MTGYGTLTTALGVMMMLSTLELQLLIKIKNIRKKDKRKKDGGRKIKRRKTKEKR